MHTSAIEILEFSQVREIIAGKAISPLGADRVRNLNPAIDIELVISELKKVAEMEALLESEETPPFRGIHDLREPMRTVIVEGGMLSPESLLKFASTLACARLVRKFFESRASRASKIAYFCRWIQFFTDFENAAHHAIDESAEVRDNASPELKIIRSQITSEKRRVRETLARLLKEWDNSGILQESIIASRGDRLTLPVKDNMKSRVTGILVDQSASGSTAFIEPLETVEINNRLRRLELEEKREVERILKYLTSLLYRRRIEVEETLETLAEIDCIYARAEYAREFDCSMPKMSTDNRIRIVNGRHPLLLIKQKEVVPLDLELGGEFVTMVISGPNAGGKTVALKTVGLLTLMASAGCFVPAEKGTELPLPLETHAVIGDEQSIAADLSTFTGHVAKLTKVVETSQSRKLVLIDEIMSGTDPNEGSALAIAIMERLTADSALTLVTTHKGDLKAYAHRAEKAVNGSMEFDAQTLSPTYRFRAGIPGSSYAFAISQQVGLSEEITSRARKIQGEEREALDGLIIELQAKLSEAIKESAKSKAAREKWEIQQNLYTDRLKNIKTIERKLKEKAEARAEAIIAEAKRSLEQAVKTIREGDASKEAIKAAHEIIDRSRDKLARPKKSGKLKPASGPIKIGDRVKIEDTDIIGEVLDQKKGSGKFLVLAGDLKMWTNAGNLFKVETEDGGKRREVKVHHTITVSHIPPELDIRGLDGIEAAAQIEEYMAKVSSEHYERIDIIHGKGRGVLKKVTADVLEGSPYVKSFRHGKWGEGNDGVTIVELKQE